MIKPITIILGAGVNKEIDSRIDTGEELIVHIADRVTDRTSTPGFLSNELEKIGYSRAIREKFVSHLDKYKSEVISPSIDEFLYEVESYPEFKDVRKEFLDIGRIVIFSHVLGWEGTSVSEFLREELTTKKTWLSVIATFIESNDLFNNDQLKIITFNYDRILEHFLYLRFGDKIANFLKSNLIHFYGRLGNFDGVEQNYRDEKPVGFGYNNGDLKTIYHLKDQIQLALERETVEIERINGAIVNACNDGRVIVCGYGLNSINNSRLRFQDFIDKSANFFFNVYPGTTPSDFKKRRGDANTIRSMLLGAQIFYNRSCREFFERSLNNIK